MLADTAGAQVKGTFLQRVEKMNASTLIGSGKLQEIAGMVAMEGIDLVIVMAAAYSDEVANIIADRFPALSHVAILRDTGLEVVRG